MEFRNKRGLYLKPEIMDFYIRKRPWVQKSEAIQKLIRKLQVHVPENLKSVREKGVLAMDTVRRFPVVSWFTNPGVITWMMLIGFFALWTKRRYTSILEFLPVFWSLPAIAEEWKSAVLISGLLYGSGTSCCRLWKFAGGTSKCNRRHKRSVKKKKSRKQKKA